MRADTGIPRVLTGEAAMKIHELREKFPYITGKAVYRKLIEEGVINSTDVSLATVHRYIRNNDLKAISSDSREVRAFEMEYANDCWQSDASTGPIIRISGKKTPTFLYAVIDDASRQILHAQFYLNGNAVNMQDSFKKAVAKFGIPKMLFTDNGKSFNNLQLQLICASLGIVMAKTRPYVAEGSREN